MKVHGEEGQTTAFEALLHILREVQWSTRKTPYWYQIVYANKVKCFENIGTLDQILCVSQEEALHILEAAGVVAKHGKRPMTIKTQVLLKIATDLWGDAVLAEKTIFKHGSPTNTFILIGGTDVNACSLREQLSEEIPPPQLDISAIRNQEKFHMVPSISRLITTIPDITDSDDDTLSMNG